MRNEFFANIEAGAAAVRSLACSSADRLTRQLASDPVRESQNQLPCPEKPAEPTVRFSRQVLADFFRALREESSQIRGSVPEI